MFYEVWEGSMAFKNLCSTTDIKTALKPKFPESNGTPVTTYDTLLDTWIKMASRLMSRIAGVYWCVNEQNKSIYWDGNGSDIVQLPVPQIQSITGIYDDLDRAYGTDTLLSSDDYVIAKNKAVIQLDNGIIFTRGKKNIKFLGTFGWASDSVFTTNNQDLVQICVSAVVRKFNKRLQLGIGTQQGGDGSLTVIDAGDFTKEENNYLKSYRPNFF